MQQKATLQLLMKTCSNIVMKVHRTSTKGRGSNQGRIKEGESNQIKSILEGIIHNLQKEPKTSIVGGQDNQRRLVI